MIGGYSKFKIFDTFFLIFRVTPMNQEEVPLFKAIFRLFVVLFSFGIGGAQASHFRSGQIAWEMTSGTTVEFTIVSTWRSGTGGSTLQFGDGVSSAFSPSTGTSLGAFTDVNGEGYEIWENTLTHTYSGTGPYQTYFSSCCRISSLGNGASSDYTVRSTVDMTGGNTGGPTTVAPVLLQVPQSAFTYTFPIADPDGDSATCSLESGGTDVPTPPAGLSVSSSCVLSFDGSSYSSGSKYAYQVKLTESGTSSTASTSFDGMIQVVAGNLPVCTGGGSHILSAGQAFNATVVGTDADGGSLTASLVNGPTGSTISPTTGTEPLSTTFSWTPSTADVGAYASLVTFTDSSGFEGSCSLGLTVLLYPTADAGGPYSTTEGSTIALDASSSAAGDPNDSTSAITTYEWDCDADGTVDVSSSNATGDTCGYPSDGSYSLTLKVTDGYSLTDTVTTTVSVSNVAPTISTTAATSANISELYSYVPSASDPGGDALTWSWSGTLPTGMSISGSTGEITWTPTYAEWLSSTSYTFQLVVSDGTDTTGESITIILGFVDADGDGMADVWESANGLDSTDASDASADADGDGLTNYEEFLNGQDPNSFDGPTAPVLVFPGQDGLETTQFFPTFVWENSSDPQGESLVYQIEVYADVSLTTLVASGEVPENTSGLTGWESTVSLSDNTGYFLRVSASDGHVWGDWSVVNEIFVNSANDGPPVASLVYPVGGEIASSLMTTLEWVNQADIDRDQVFYDVEIVLFGSPTLVYSIDGFEMGQPSEINARLTIDVSLEEDLWYQWRVRAIDEHGLEADWSDWESFVASEDNAAPEGVYFLDPVAEGSVVALQPMLTASEGYDSEGYSLRYLFEVDTVSTFDSAAFISFESESAVDGVVWWDLSEDAAWTLVEHGTYYARVRGVDPQDIGSLWDTISFFVRGENDAPETPSLISPENGSRLDSVRPQFVVGATNDAESDRYSYDIRLAWDAEYTQMAATIQGLPQTMTGGEMTWLPGMDLEGTMYWSARAVDSYGAASEWSETWELTLGDGDSAGGCACTGLGSQRPSGLWGLLLGGLVFARRRNKALK